MMALFLVLWLTAQDTKIKEAIERSFKNPFASLTKESVGIIPNPDATAVKPDRGNFDSPSAAQLEVLRRITDDLAKLLQEHPEDQATVKLEMTSEGLRISVFDQSQRPIFKGGRDALHPVRILGVLHHCVGHRAIPDLHHRARGALGGRYARPGTGVHLLGAFRRPRQRQPAQAHRTRRRSTQVFKVAGFGDTQPLAGATAEAEVNRRVSVLLRLPSNPPTRRGRDPNPVDRIPRPGVPLPVAPRSLASAGATRDSQRP